MNATAKKLEADTTSMGIALAAVTADLAAHLSVRDSLQIHDHMEPIAIERTECGYRVAGNNLSPDLAVRYITLEALRAWTSAVAEIAEDEGRRQIRRMRDGR